MIKRLTITLLLSQLFTIWCFSQPAGGSERLREIVREHRQAGVTIPFPGREQMATLTKNVSILSVREKTVYILLSPLTVEWFISAGYDYSIVERDDSKGIASSVNMSQAMEWNTYPTYSQYDSIMRFLASSYPDFCRLDTIGTSVLGKLVLALKISDNCSQDEPEPEVFYTSSIHGDETGGFILMMRLADYLLKNHGSGRVKNIVDNLEIWINPLANPDGTYNDGDVMVAPVRNNANNYDLNRNFPDPATPNTVKQKETIDMMRFLARHRFVLSANFHSGEEVVNYPWDRWERDHPDKDWFYRISRAYADTVHLHAPYGYMNFLDNGVTNGYYWYLVNGGRQDYVTYELQGREVTIELDLDYITPVGSLNELWEFNRRSLLGYLENAVYGISGVVKDALTGKPVPAMITIEEHDKDHSQVYADTVTGEFVRLLEPGTWDLNFSASGYQTKVLNGVILSPGSGVTRIVEMDKVLNPVDTTNPVKPLLYPNPGNDIIFAVLPESLIGKVNVRIFNQTGMKMSDYNTTYLYGHPLLLDVRTLASGSYIVVFTGTDSSLSYRSRFIVASQF
ncbi:MAG: M14 family zinc carboxypeptidase [Bacteroidales bacterium]